MEEIKCNVCDKPIKIGEKVYPLDMEGYVHVKCSKRESGDDSPYSATMTEEGLVWDDDGAKVIVGE